jgi:Tfp pilus assembly protein PilO
VTVSMKRIGGVTAAIAVVLVAVWYAALIRPQRHDLSAAHKKYDAAATQASQLQQQVSTLQAVLRQVPADTAKLKVLDAALPTTEDLQDVLNMLHQSAVTSGVQLTSVAPSNTNSSSSSSGSSSSTGGSATKQIGLTMALSGQYPQVMTFITDLVHLNRVVVIDGATFSPNPTNGMTASLSARIFYAS